MWRQNRSLGRCPIVPYWPGRHIVAIYIQTGSANVASPPSGLAPTLPLQRTIRNKTIHSRTIHSKPSSSTIQHGPWRSSAHVAAENCGTLPRTGMGFDRGEVTRHARITAELGSPVEAKLERVKQLAFRLILN